MFTFQRVITALIVIFLCGCGEGFEVTHDLTQARQSPDGNVGPIDDGPGAEVPDVALVYSMTEYPPENPVAHHNPTEYMFPHPVQVQIPESIAVTQGNAGNRNLFVTFNSGAHLFMCHYRGGSEVASPIETGDSELIRQGLFYHWVNCSNGAAPGVWVDVLTSINIRANGDPSETTKVRGEFPVSF